LGLKDAITGYFETRPRAKKVLGIATAIATNFAMIGSGSAVLAVAAGSIVKAREDETRVRSDQLMDFFKEAIQDPTVRDSLKEAVREGGIPVATPVATAMNQLGANAPETGQFVDTMKSDLTVVLQNLGILQEMLSYYEIPDSLNRMVNVWRLPPYLDDVLVIEDARKAVIDAAVKHAREGENVVILGAPGSGKTTVMYAIWKEVDEDRDTALVWDTKDVARTHEKDGVILFNDDLPETKELAKAIVERDVRGIVATAREQDWSRLPIDLRSKFNPINLPNISDEVMAEIATKHLESQGVSFEKKVLPAIVESAQGSPIYVRYLVEEISSEIKSGKTSKLTAKRIKRAPKGMTDYVAGILARILFELDGTIYKPKAGALPVIKSLLCLADLPNYETHEVHLNQMFFALKQPSDSPGPFNAFKQYLSRDPRFYSLKFMHDTLADVLRGKVDHPVVGDIRLVAQEMGVAGRRKIERDALDEGWEHVKAEYEIDQAGGLDSMLAYSYFAAKNFGVEHIDSLALKLANQYLENPISQGLFALTGPITEVPVTEAKPTAPSPKTIETAKAAKAGPPMGLEKTISDQIAAAGADIKVDEILKELGNLEELKKLGDIGTIISKEIDSAMSKSEESRKTSIELLEEAIDDESITPRKLTRRLLKASRRIMILSETGRLTNEEEMGNLIVAGAERLVRMDYARYLETLEHISEALADTLGEEESSNAITRISELLPIKELDQSSRKKLEDTYNKSMRQAAKIDDYSGMVSHIENKWKLLGFDTDDLTFISDEFGKLIKKGRARFALVQLRKLGSYYGESDIEIRIGMTLQAFKNLSKAPIKDRNHFNSIIEAALKLFEELISSIDVCDEEICKELIKSQAIADLSLASISSAVSLMDNYVKRPGKSVSAATAYPLLHEAVRPLISLALKTLKRNGNVKTIKSAKTAINKMRGESSAKEAMVIEVKSHFG
jgi:energy-coupling factor transporter ATP-binding protein EcfA2